MVSSSKILEAGILIVDDEEANVALLEQMLQGAGYVSLSSTTDPREVCERHRQNRYSLILLDLQMPAMDGFEVMEGLKAIEGEDYLPVLVVTAQPSHKMRALKAGARDFVSKPFDLGEVLMRAHNMLEVRLLFLETKRLCGELGAKQQASEQLMLIFRSSPGPMSIATVADGRIIDANDEHCRFFGYSREEISRRSVRDLSLWANPQDRLPVMQRLLKEGAVRGFEAQQRRKSGEVRDVLASLELINLSGMTEPVLISTFIDITERKLAEEQVCALNAGLEQRVAERTSQLQAANQELQAFSHSVSHDLRAPLRHIQGFVHLLQNEDESSLSEESVHHLASISKTVDRMGKLIEDLLNFSRIGHSTLKKKEVNLDQLVGETVKDFQEQTAERAIAWEIQPLPSVWADDSLLHLVLVNLISNAVKFTGHRAEAKIEIGRAQGAETETAIFIRDNGAGFDPRYSAKLFGMFQRLHSQSDFEGTGIGLANVQQIIQRHGGRAWAEGAVEGGATFYFSIPDRTFDDRKALRLEPQRAFAP